MKNLFDNFDDNGQSDSDPSNDLTGNSDDILQSSDHHGDSFFNGGDSGEFVFHDNFHDSGIPDMNQPDWNDTHSGFHDNFNDSGITDMNPSGWNDSSPISQSDHYSDSDFQNHGHDPLHDLANPDPHHTDWTDTDPDMSNPDYHQPEFQPSYGDTFESHHQNLHDPNQMSHTSHHSLHSMQAHSVHFASSTNSNHPYTTLGDSGHVYLNGEKEIGHIDGHTVYNKGNWNCGYWTTEGNVYDYHDHLVGWVHPDGHVYAKGSNGDLEVYETSKGVAGGAAYLLLVWCGGQTHI